MVYLWWYPFLPSGKHTKNYGNITMLFMGKIHKKSMVDLSLPRTFVGFHDEIWGFGSRMIFR
jgi:hypothetical protein